jgi:hypothetical protein
MFYVDGMRRTDRQPAAPASLSLKLGSWLEAHATGWGVAAIPVVLGLLLGAAALRWMLA